MRLNRDLPFRILSSCGTFETRSGLLKLPARFAVSRPSAAWLGFTGRITALFPRDITGYPLDSHHFHLVGNGEMGYLVRKALHRAGVARERVSIEMYFNHHAGPAADEVEMLARQFRDRN